MDRFDKSLLKEKQIYLGTVLYLMIIHKTNCLPLCMSQNHFTVFLHMSLITLCEAVAPEVTVEPGMWVEFPC